MSDQTNAAIVSIGSKNHLIYINLSFISIFIGCILTNIMFLYTLPDCKVYLSLSVQLDLNISQFSLFSWWEFIRLYSPERRILFDLIEHYIPKFSSFKKSQKLDIILQGFEIENLEFIGLNTTLTIAVQKFIMQTKRFYVPPSPL